MVPDFPSFKKLGIEDKKELEKYTKKFPPYSDYNFVSLYSYDTEADALISNLNGNLVIRFRDYITNEPFYSFIGKSKVVETARELLKRAKTEKIMDKLQLIPEAVVKSDKNLSQQFRVTEDPDNFDYILSLEKISKMSGGKFQDKRNLVNRFWRENPDAKIKILDPANSKIQNEVMKLFNLWAEKKQKPKEEAAHERKAIQRLLDASSNFDLIAIGIYKKGALISFAISEIIYEKYSVFHFVKANISYKGIFEATYNALSKELIIAGCVFINYEQDLGIENLKKSKQLWRPVNFLKKYIISEKF